MSADPSSHRKVAQYEWTDTVSTAGKGAPQAAPPPSTSQGGQVKEFYGGAIACGEKKAYIVGGYDPKIQRSIRQVVEWTIASRQWSRQVDFPERLSRATAVAFEDYCFVFGGWDDVGFSNKLWVLIPSPVVDSSGSGSAGNAKNKDIPYTYHWECLPPLGTSVESPKEIPCARVGHSFVLGQVSTTVPGEKKPVIEPVIYLFGGLNGKERLNDVWRLSIRETVEKKEAAWERVEVKAGTPPSPRDDAAVAFASNSEKLYVFGGYSNALCNDLSVFELKDGRNQWTDLPIQGAPTRRQGSIAAADDHQLILCMGTTEEQQSIPQLLQISFKDYKWKLLAVDQCVDVLSDRAGYVGCCGVGNRRLLIYGGGRVPYHSSMVEIELERSETVSKKK